MLGFPARFLLYLRDYGFIITTTIIIIIPKACSMLLCGALHGTPPTSSSRTYIFTNREASVTIVVRNTDVLGKILLP
jgi:hypothetical protein